MRWMNRALTALMATALLVGVLAMAGPLSGRYRTTTVVTGSMSPTIDPGDMIVAFPKPSDEVAKGDIVTFQNPDTDGTTTHRVVDVDRQDGQLVVTTKGDRNETVDSSTVTFVGGTAWETRVVVPKVGYAFVAGRAVLEHKLYLPLIGLLLGASLLWTIWRPEKKDLDVVAA